MKQSVKNELLALASVGVIKGFVLKAAMLFIIMTMLSLYL